MKIKTKKKAKKVEEPPTQETHTAYVEERVWGPDDTYLVIGDVQVFSDAFQKGDEVEITIRKTGKTIHSLRGK